MKSKIVDTCISEHKFTANPISEKLHEFINTYLRDYGEDPHCLLLGPNEYIDLMGEVARSRYNPWGGVEYPHTYCGIPIRVKKSPGIDAEIRPEAVFKFAKESK